MFGWFKDIYSNLFTFLNKNANVGIKVEQWIIKEMKCKDITQEVWLLMKAYPLLNEMYGVNVHENRFESVV